MRFSYLLILSYIVFAQNSDSNKNQNILKVGDAAPTFFIRTLDNKKFYLSDEIKKEKPILFSFFATWCEPCKKELPLIDSLSTQFKDISFYIINVSGIRQGKKVLKEDPVLVKKMLNNLNVGLPVLYDKYAQTVAKYGEIILPKTAIIDKKGNLAYLHTGFDATVRKDIIKVLEDVSKSK
ncbi:MAG: redoxin domain-containing protein [Pelagibacterales bacterium]|nr:redoxin domain-containing protein [Pelagibacterales bacterium]